MPHSTAATTSTTTPQSGPKHQTSTTFPTATINNTNIPIYPLETLSYSLLIQKDPTETQRLFHACQNPGFFDLHFDDETGQEILNGLQKIYAISKEHFDQPPEDKIVDPKWKPETQNGNLEIPHDSLLTNNLNLPPSLSAHTTLLSDFYTTTHSINRTLLALLSDAYGLPTPGWAPFESHHRPNHPSDSALNLIHAPTKPLASEHPDTTHTDSGTLTLLFTREWGIQLEDPGTDGGGGGRGWGFIEPKEGCGLVNVGDALMRMSGEVVRGCGGDGGRDEGGNENGDEGGDKGGQGGVVGKGLHSCRHRITQVGDGVQRRHFVVDYLRPEKGR